MLTGAKTFYQYHEAMSSLRRRWVTTGHFLLAWMILAGLAGGCRAAGRTMTEPRPNRGDSALAETRPPDRLLARIPFDVNSMDVRFTTVGHYRGHLEVYRDSVVVILQDGMLQTRLLRGREQTVDSVTASLGARTASSWSEGTLSNALVTEWKGTEGESRPLPRGFRFIIPRAKDDSLGGRWLVFTHHLTVPKTADNPLGRAWTYAHGPAGMFTGAFRE